MSETNENKEPVAVGSDSNEGLGAELDLLKEENRRLLMANKDCINWYNDTKQRMDRYMRALVHIRANAESQLRAIEVCVKIAGEFQPTTESINARWNYTEANAALSA